MTTEDAIKWISEVGTEELLVKLFSVLTQVGEVGLVNEVLEAGRLRAESWEDKTWTEAYVFACTESTAAITWRCANAYGDDPPHTTLAEAEEMGQLTLTEWNKSKEGKQ